MLHQKRMCGQRSVTKPSEIAAKVMQRYFGYQTRKAEWQRKIESVACEMISEKNKDDLLIFTDPTPMIKEFMTIVEHLDKVMAMPKGRGGVLVSNPWDRENEE